MHTNSGREFALSTCCLLNSYFRAAVLGKVNFAYVIVTQGESCGTLTGTALPIDGAWTAH